MPNEFRERSWPEETRQLEVHEAVTIAERKENRIPIHHLLEQRFVEELALEKSPQKGNALGGCGDDAAIRCVGG